MQACVWGGENQDESFSSSSIFLLPVTVTLDGCTQLLGSLIARFQTCAMSSLVSLVSNIGKKQGAKCL